MRRLIGFIVILAVVLFGLSFALLNSAPVEVDYYLGIANLPLSLALVAALVLGALLGVCFTAAVALRQRRALAHARRRLNQAERELSELRQLPVRNVA